MTSQEANERASELQKSGDDQGAYEWYLKAGNEHDAKVLASEAAYKLEKARDYKGAILWYFNAGDTENSQRISRQQRTEEKE